MRTFIIERSPFKTICINAVIISAATHIIAFFAELPPAVSITLLESEASQTYDTDNTMFINEVSAINGINFRIRLIIQNSG